MAAWLKVQRAQRPVDDEQKSRSGQQAEVMGREGRDHLQGALARCATFHSLQNRSGVK